jgi:small subunit ribosomal protein S8
MMTDPIADLLTRLRNAYSIGRRHVEVPHSKIKEAICHTLKREGYLNEVNVAEGAPRDRIKVELRYGRYEEPAVQHIQRVSTPGRRRYRQAETLGRVAGGTGISILTTSKGILSDREARKENVGGEVLCEVW